MRKYHRRYQNYPDIFGDPRPETIFVPHVLEKIGEITGGTILDIGTGHGYKLRRIIEKNTADIRKVVALEPSPLWKKQQKKKKKLVSEGFLSKSLMPFLKISFRGNRLMLFLCLTGISLFFLFGFLVASARVPASRKSEADLCIF